MRVFVPAATRATSACSSSWRRATGCRCGTCVRASRRSRTSSRGRSGRGDDAMPIHDQSYRRYRGGRATPGRAWLVIARAGIRQMLTRRAFLAVLLFAWLPFVVRAVQIYIAPTIPQVAAVLAPDARMFRDFLEPAGLLRLHRDDLRGRRAHRQRPRANALQIYLSKPLMRAEYIAGKAAVLFVFLLLVTWVPAMLLLLLQVMFRGSFEFLRANVFLFPAITVAPSCRRCSRRSRCWRSRRSRRAAATSGSSMRASSSSPRRLRRAVRRDHRQQRDVVVSVGANLRRWST
jgi:hypothetical protein